MSNDRIKAKKRAKKMFRILFQQKYYGKIMKILNSPPAPGRKAEFNKALGNEFVQAEKDWLWKYLQWCNKDGFGGWSDAAGLPETPGEVVEDAAKSGW